MLPSRRPTTAVEGQSQSIDQSHAVDVRDGAVVVGIAIATALYLLPYVSRGWIPHDEGMLGQLAERILQGEIPHVDFQDPYTSALSWLSAAVFTLVDADLLSLRWSLFAAAVCSVFPLYFLARTCTGRLPSVAVTVSAIVWAFPNYFAAIPSWWSLVFTLFSVYCLSLYFERRIAVWLFAAGVLGGISLAFKQTGAYFLAVVPLILLFDEQIDQPIGSRSQAVRSVSFWVRVAAAVPIVTIAVALGASSGVSSGQLVAPLVAVIGVVLIDALGRSATADFARVRAACSRIAVFVLGSLVPLGLLLVPYISGSTLPELWSGAVVLPQRRVQFAAMPLPDVVLLLLGFPIASILLTAWPSRTKTVSVSIPIASIVAAASLLLMSLKLRLVYQIVWMSAWTLGVAAPLLAAAIVWDVRRVSTAYGRRVLLLALATATFALVQIPFAAPIYFCYVAPLLVLLLTAIAAGPARSASALWIGPWFLLTGFAVISMNRGYIDTLASRHVVADLSTPLNINRASLMVSETDAHVYGRIVRLIERHGPNPVVYAGPDCPEIYFLADVKNPTRELFGFFLDWDAIEQARVWTSEATDIVVVNHMPSFSGSPDARFLREVRRHFPLSETIGHFEVRWR